MRACEIRSRAMVQPEQRKCETLEEDDPRRKFDADGDNVMCSTTVKLSWFSGALPHAHVAQHHKGCFSMLFRKLLLRACHRKTVTLCTVDVLPSPSDRNCQEPANDIEGAHNLTDVLLNTAGRTCLKSITSTSNVGTKSEAKSEIFVEYLATVRCIDRRPFAAAPV